MRKIAIAGLLVLLLTLCSCSSQTEKTKQEGTAAPAAVSSDVREDSTATSPAEAQESGTAPSTLPTEQDDGHEDAVIKIDGDNAVTTTKDAGSATETATADTTAASERTSGEGISMPRIEVPRN